MYFHIPFSITNWNKASFHVLLDKTSRLFMLLVFLLSLIGGTTTTVKAAGTITLDGTVSTVTADDVSTVDISHTTGTGTNRLMLVGVSWNSNTAARTISSVTFSYGTVPTVLSLTPVISQKHGSNYRYSAIYSLPNPPDGETGTVTVNFSGGTVTAGIVVGVANFAGVDPTAPIGVSVGAYSPSNNTTPTVTLNGLNSDELVFDTVFLGGNPPATLTVGSDQTELTNWNTYIANTRGSASIEQAVSGSVTMSWTAASSSMWVIAAVAINPAPAGPTQDLSMAVSPSGGGTTDPSEGDHTYPQNEVVNLTATPNVGYVFDSWIGDSDCTDGSVTMDVDKACTANFTATNYDLTMAVDPVDSGITIPAVGSHSYGAGAVVDITAQANPGYAFDHWAGAGVADVNAANTTVAMDATKTITAHFVEGPPIILDGIVSSGTADGVATFNIDHTTGIGPDRLMLVGVSANSYNGAQTISSVEFVPDVGETKSFTEVGSVENEAGRLAAIYGLVNPPEGQPGTVTITFSGTVNYGIVAGVANFAGVDQNNPWGAFASNTGQSTTQSVDVTGLVGNELVFDTMFIGAATIPTPTVGTGQTEQWSTSVDRAGGAASIEVAAAPGSVTMSWSTGSTSVYWAIGAVPINPASTEPTIAITGTPLSDFASQPGVPSAEQSYTVSGSNLTDDITITPPTDFEISLTSGSGWTTSPLVLTPTGDSVAATDIFVRFNRASAGTSVGDVTHTSAGAAQRDVAVSGTATPVYTITATAGANGNIDPSGVIAVTEGDDLGFAITPANACYQVADVLVDSSSVGAVTSYDFINVTGNHTIEASFEPLPPGRPCYRVNAGGDTLTDPDPDFLELHYPDLDTVPGLTVTNVQDERTTTDTIDITNTPGVPMELFQTILVRGTAGQTMSFDFTVPDGDYNVLLHFAEHYFDASGERIFDVSVEGVEVLTDYDIWVAAGGTDTAVTETILTTVGDGELNLDFTAQTSDAAIRGIEIIPASTCFALSLSHTGEGSDPVASPTKSAACSAESHYLAGEAITLSGAVPNAGWRIAGWTGTDDDSLTTTDNTLTMPGNDHQVDVNYVNPHVVASVAGDWFWTTDFVPNGDLTISIYASQGGALLWGPTVAQADEGGFLVVQPSDHFLDLVPGNYIEVSDGETTKGLVLETITMEVFDLNNDIMSGTAPTDRYVWASAGTQFEQHGLGVTSDEFGDWTADLSSLVDITEEMRIWSFAQIFDDDGDANEANPPALPSFAASFPEGTVQGYDWPLGVDVSITIDDPDNGEGVDYTDTQTVVVADWDPSMTVVNFPLDGFTLEPGQLINMTDGITIKEHTVTYVTITDVNLDTETATGTAAPGTDVWVLYCNMSDCPEDQNVTSDGSGNWSATFTDIQAGDAILAHQFDDDSDHTAYEWRVPFPTFSARFPAGVVHGYEWPEGEFVTISIDDPTNGAGEDYTTSETVGIADWDPNMTFVEFTLDGFVLEPGHIITMTHGTTVKVHTVTNVTIIAVDIDTETVEGTADPGTDVTVDLCNDSGCEFQDVIADGATGDWSVTFADIVAGDNISAMQHDEDGDHTAYEWQVLKPYVEGSTNSNWVHARDWPDGTELTLEVDDPSDGTGDVDYTVTATMGPAPWNPGDPNDIVADFDMDGFDLQPGHILHITDGLSPTTEVTYTLTDLAVTEIDVATDIISGVATLSDDVQVCANVADNCVFHTATPSGGTWDVDYGGEVDLVAGINGWAAQYDSNGNATWFDWRVPNPNFEARPLDDLVEGFEWILGAAVTLEVNGTPYNSPQTVIAAPWNPDETYVSFDLNGLHDLVPGDLVTLTDGVTLKEHIVTGLTVVDVDDVLNTISGTTDSPLNVDVWEHNDYENSHVTVTPVSGDWTADLTAFDLDAGHMGAAAQYDDDGDGTWIEWWVPYTLTVNIDGLGSGSVELDPEGGSYRPGTEVTLTAIPESGSAFTGWFGDLGGGDNPTSINMDGNKVVVANFELVDKTNLYVDVSGSDSNPGTEAAPFATIQKAVDELDPGGTVHVGVGTYIQNVVITKSLTLVGAGVGTIIQPAVSNPNPCTGSSMCGGAASNVLLVQADDVVIHDLTVDGDNPALTGLDVGGANVDARNGIIKNTDATYNNLEVYNVTVKNIYLRGIYSTNGSFNFHDNTVTNVQGDSYSIAMFAWGGPGIMEANTVSYANDGVSANHSNGIQFLNNVVTHSLSGVHTDNSGDSGGVADLIQGNSVDCTDTPGAYGVWVFVPYIAPTVDNNTVTNCDVGLSAWGQGAAVTTQFTNNTVIGNLAAESVGAYITTDLISWGYTDVSVNFSGNEITGFETGVFLTANEQSWNPEPYEAKTINATFHLNQISGNTAGADKDSSGTYLADFENNWWGDATGPQSPVWNGGGDTVSAGFDYSPWCANAACTEFAEEGYTLSIVSEHGSVTKTPDQVTYQLNDMVSLEVTPVAGWNFTDWSGDISGTDNPITVTITGDMNVTANFSPAAVTHSISLVPGWNLVSFNLQPVSTDIEDVLSSIDGNYNLVYAWDASGAHAGSGNWMKYDPAAPAYSNSLSSLDETMGFWIYMEVADTLDVVGCQPTTTEITLTDDVGGWNLVAYPSTFNGGLPEVMRDQGVGSDFSLIYAYHANETGDPWKLFDRAAPEFANDLSELAPGWGYWVRVSADNTWSVEYAAP